MGQVTYTCYRGLSLELSYCFKSRNPCHLTHRYLSGFISGLPPPCLSSLKSMLPSTPCSAAYDSGELNLPCVVPEHLVDMADQVTLCSDSGGHTEALLPKKASPTPVPKLQLISLCLARLSEPITFTQVIMSEIIVFLCFKYWWQIFPYVNEMMLELGVAHSPSQVGFYSGLVVRKSFNNLSGYIYGHDPLHTRL